jgi:DNA replication and repair protein RecF
VTLASVPSNILPFDPAARVRPLPALRRIDLTDFRNYAFQRLDLAGRSVVLTGPNGAGKTNLLEAVSFLSPGRGLRRARLSEAARQGSAGRWAVAARLDTAAGELLLGTGTAANDGDDGERRAVHVDGRVASGPAVLSDHLGLAWLTPQMDRLFVEGASARRRFLDRLVYGFDPGHARRVAAFERAMRERNRLLEAGGEARWLTAQEETMAEQAVAVAAARRDGAVRLQDALDRAPGPFPRALIAIDGLIEGWLDEQPALAAEDRYRALLASQRALDAAAGLTLQGPHKSDLLVRHAGKDQPAAQCSTGEQKALLIAMVLANARLAAERRGAAPILLLDEVVAHLDRMRREALFDELAALRTQAWMTGTDGSLFEALGDRAEFFTVRDGRVAHGFDRG